MKDIVEEIKEHFVVGEDYELKSFVRVQEYDGTAEGNIVYKLHGKEGSSKQTIKVAREEKSIAAEFLLSCILPLFAFDFTLWNQAVLFFL